MIVLTTFVDIDIGYIVWVWSDSHSGTYKGQFPNSDQKFRDASRAVGMIPKSGSMRP
jgi:hypothetical protein